MLVMMLFSFSIEIRHDNEPVQMVALHHFTPVKHASSSIHPTNQPTMPPIWLCVCLSVCLSGELNAFVNTPHLQLDASQNVPMEMNHRNQLASTWFDVCFPLRPTTTTIINSEIKFARLDSVASKQAVEEMVQAAALWVVMENKLLFYYNHFRKVSIGIPK